MRPEQFKKFKSLLCSRLERYFYPVIESYSSDKTEEIHFELIRRMDRQEEIAEQIKAFLLDQEKMDDLREFLLGLLEELGLEADLDRFAKEEKIVFSSNHERQKMLELKFHVNDCRLVVKTCSIE